MRRVIHRSVLMRCELRPLDSGKYARGQQQYAFVMAVSCAFDRYNGRTSDEARSIIVMVRSPTRQPSPFIARYLKTSSRYAYAGIFSSADRFNDPIPRPRNVSSSWNAVRPVAALFLSSRRLIFTVSMIHVDRRRTGLRKDPGEEQVEADPGGSKGRTGNSKFQLQSDAGKNRGLADVQIGRLCPVSTVDTLHDLEDRHGILILCYDPKRKGIKGLQRYKCEDYVQFQLPISQST